MNESGVAGLYSVEVNDPFQELLSRHGVDPKDLAQVNKLMEAMGRLRTVERRLSDAAAQYMRLNGTDMRALHFLLNQSNQGISVTPGAIAAYLEVSAASITKMIDRLEKGGHLVRHPHPTDRRATILEITESTRKAALVSMGQYQIVRVKAAMELTDTERDVVTRFLERTAEHMAEAMDEGASAT